eukprot:7226614-Pyramimonas_sp.AAC.1
MRARKAVAALRRLGLDDSNAVVLTAKKRLATAGTAERLLRTREDLLRRALDRHAAKIREVTNLQAVVDKLKAEYESRLN